MGLELQLEELVEARARAEAQGDAVDPGLEAQIRDLQAELAAVVEGHTAGRAVIHAPTGAQLDASR